MSLPPIVQRPPQLNRQTETRAIQPCRQRVVHADAAIRGFSDDTRTQRVVGEDGGPRMLADRALDDGSESRVAPHARLQPIEERQRFVDVLRQGVGVAAGSRHVRDQRARVSEDASDLHVPRLQLPGTRLLPGLRQGAPTRRLAFDAAAFEPTGRHLCDRPLGFLLDRAHGSVGVTADGVHATLGFLFETRDEVGETHRLAAGYPPPPRRISTATTKPRITIVSGMAMRMIAVVASSGFSARLAAAAGPMRPWAQAVARAERPTASAAASPRSAISITCRSSSESCLPYGAGRQWPNGRYWPPPGLKK